METVVAVVTGLMSYEMHLVAELGFREKVA